MDQHKAQVGKKDSKLVSSEVSLQSSGLNSLWPFVQNVFASNL